MTENGPTVGQWAKIAALVGGFITVATLATGVVTWPIGPVEVQQMTLATLASLAGGWISFKVSEAINHD